MAQNQNNDSFPKTIWFLWFQGLPNAPLVVKKCYASWLAHNPGWNIILLDEHNIKEYLAPPMPQGTRQVVADRLRINLLVKYGGVWVDATCYCTRPLDSWLNEYMAQGFFAFNRPGPDRMLSNWFMAAAKNTYITVAFQKAFTAYWENNPGTRLIDGSRWDFLNKYLQRRGTGAWFGFFATKVLKVYPYFVFHYLFKKLYLADAGFKSRWDAVPKISADIPHSLQTEGLFKPLSKQIKQKIDDKTSPCYKLTWKYDPAELKEGTVMSYLLNGAN